MNGREAYNRLLDQAERFDSYISRVIEDSYGDTMLICHPVTSRNPYSSSVFLKLEAGRSLPVKKRTFPIVPLLKYYLKSIAGFLLHLASYFCFAVSALRVDLRRIDKSRSLIVISTYTMIDKICARRAFDDPYFGSLYQVLGSRNSQYVVLCILFGDKPWDFRKRIQTYNILSRDGRNFITEYELMGLSEWADLARFIIVYPFKVLRLSRVNFGDFDGLFRHESITTLSRPQFHHYIRYLVGRRLKELTDRQVKLIDWYENQTISKLLFRGLRESGAESEIFGCQFFTKQPLLRNLYPLRAESVSGVVPDTILISGEYYLKDFDKDLNVKVGISPRSSYLFDVKLNEEDVNRRRDLLVLTTYDVPQSKHIISLVESLKTDALAERVVIKLHPNHILSQPFLCPANWVYSEEHLARLCLNSSIVVTSGSDTALEAAAMGCSVIIVGETEGLTFNPMPDYGAGRIWELVFDMRDLERAVAVLSDFRKSNPSKIKEMALVLRNMFFTEATEERHVQLFDL